ncbi:hypothetical protein [Nitrosomonas communis]|uniref:hypothetical protein n=1 Tax=Nitrosomonas communis TaxID=44574 RepID=UPI0026EFC2F3|nr:hypothetical protein [Nitrosomonas communis]MCO6427701.1 hypothetical protein [Nitrosomonas communis]
MKKLLFAVLVSMVFANHLYAKGGKSSASKGTFSSKSSKPSSSQPATTTQKKADTQNQPAPAPAQAQNTAPSTPASATSANTAPAAPNAAAGNPSLLQSVMPALVGGAVGSYVGSKLADDGDNEKSAEGNEAKKEAELLNP